VRGYNAHARPQISEFIRRYLGEELDTSTVSPELAVQLVAEVDRPEWFFLRREVLWAFFASIAANAGNVGHIECLVPAAATDLIVVVDAVRIPTPQTGVYSLRYDGAAGGAIVQNDVRDMRIPGLKARSQNALLNTTVGASGIIVDKASLATAIGEGDIIFTPENSSALPFILTAGHRFQVWCETQNQGFSASMGGYELTVKPESQS
jgi:hypothetical protein